MDVERRIALVDTLTVDNGNVVLSPTQLIRFQLDNHLNSAGYNYAGNKPISYKDIDGLQGDGDEKRNQQGSRETKELFKYLDEQERLPLLML